MASTSWLGGASAVAQVATLTPGGAIAAGNTFTVTLTSESGATQAVAVTATGTTVAVTCDDIVAALTPYTGTFVPAYSLFYAVTVADATTHVTLTADVAGVPFYVTCTKAQGGGGSDTHTFVDAISTSNSGPNDWNTAANWSAGTVPVATNDVYITSNAASAILYGLLQDGTLSAASPAVASVTLESISITKGMAYNVGTGTAPLSIGFNAARIGAAPDDGSNLQGPALINLKRAAGSGVVTVYGSRNQGTGGLPPVNLSGTITLSQSGGIVGCCTALPTDAATISTVSVTGGRITLGPGCTLTTVTLSGCYADIEAGGTTMTVAGNSVVYTEGVGAWTTLNGNAGYAYWGMRPTAGAGITTANIGSDVGSFTLNTAYNPAAITITDTNYKAGRIIASSASQITHTNDPSFVYSSTGTINDPNQGSSS